MSKINGLLFACLIIWSVGGNTAYMASAADEKYPPRTQSEIDAMIQHYASTGEWVPLENRMPVEDSAAVENDYGYNGYDTPEEAEAAYTTYDELQTIQEWEYIDEVTKLRTYDKLAWDVAKEFESAASAPAPFAGAQGFIMFPYGSVVPRISCRPYRVTDIALEPGEAISGIHAGDTVRWLFAPSESMQNSLRVSHIIVKPTMPNIATNLMIHTNRRTYQVDLVSVESGQYTPGVAFTYPNQNLNVLFVSQQKEQEEPVKKAMIPEGGNINNGYKIATRSTKLDWKPGAVFDDGKKTYIRMPVQVTETPVLYIRLDNKDTLVNYRVQGRYYIVDRLFDKAIMKVGARSVVLTRVEPLAKQNDLRNEIENINYSEKL